MADFLTILSDQKEELQRVTSYAKVSRIEESFLNLKSNLAQVVIGVRRMAKKSYNFSYNFRPYKTKKDRFFQNRERGRKGLFLRKKPLQGILEGLF